MVVAAQFQLTRHAKAQLTQMLSAGSSVEEIAAALDAPRPVVAGAIQRLRDADRAMERAASLVLTPVVDADDELDDDEVGIDILKITSRQCKFPVAARRDGTILFCAEPVRKAGGSFCGHHHKISYTPIQRKR